MLTKLGVFKVSPILTDSDRIADVNINVTSHSELNVLGCSAGKKLHIEHKETPGQQDTSHDTYTIQQQGSPDQALQKMYKELHTKFHELFQSGLGCLKRLQVKGCFQARCKTFANQGQCHMPSWTISSSLLMQELSKESRGQQFCKYDPHVVLVCKAYWSTEDKITCVWKVFSHSQLSTTNSPTPNAYSRRSNEQAKWKLLLLRD